LLERNDAAQPHHAGERLGAVPRPFGGVLVSEALVQPVRRTIAERGTERDVAELVIERRHRIDDVGTAPHRDRDHTEVGVGDTDRVRRRAPTGRRHTRDRRRIAHELDVNQARLRKILQVGRDPRERCFGARLQSHCRRFEPVLVRDDDAIATRQRDQRHRVRRRREPHHES